MDPMTMGLGATMRNARNMQPRGIAPEPCSESAADVPCCSAFGLQHQAQVVYLIFFLVVFPCNGLGQGVPDCFRGNPGITYEECCQDVSQAKQCWGSETDWVFPYCCGGDDRGSTAQSPELWNLLANVTR